MTKLLAALGLSSPVMLYVGAAVLLGLLGLLAHDRLTARALDREIRHAAAVEQQLAEVVETNQQTLAAFAAFKAEAAKAQAAVADDAARATKRAAALTKIRTEISHAQPSSTALGPSTLAALDGLRRLRSQGGDPAAGGKGAASAGAAGLPAGSGHP